MKKRFLIYIILIVTILFSSTVYGIMMNQENYNSLNSDVLNGSKVISSTIDIESLQAKHTLEFIVDVTGLEEEVAIYLIEQCAERSLDVFLVLGLIKIESDFNTKVVGGKGERGLGQLMENTARPLAKNLGLKYDPEKLFEPKYNIYLFTTQLEYLSKIFDNDVHKTLTAYNRGEYGLKKYMASRGSRKDSAMSVYSKKVTQYAASYKKEYYSSLVN